MWWWLCWGGCPAAIETEPERPSEPPPVVDTTVDTVPPVDTATDPPPPEPTWYAADDPHWRYAGRIDQTDPATPAFHWSGSAVSGRVQASTVSIDLESSGDTWVNVYLDDTVPSVLQLQPGRHTYEAATDLGSGPHDLRISKRTEAADGAFRFHGATLAGTLEPLDAPPTLGIEVYGDSITSTYSIECACDKALAEYKNFDLGYAALAGAELDAEVRAISVSGIGLVTSWWPETMWDYWDSRAPGDHAWDFSWQPDVVVVNLGQNDYWLGVGGDIRPAYVAFHTALRKVYPKADIVFALGSMDAVAPGSPMPNFVQQAVDVIRKTDPHVHALIFAYNGHGRHPEVADHAPMADALRDKILEIRPDLAP